MPELPDHGPCIPYSSAALDRAVRMGNMEQVIDILDSGLDVNAHDAVTALHTAAEYKRLEIAELLVSRGADPNIDSMITSSPLMHAAEHGHVEMVELLLGAGANPCSPSLGELPSKRCKDAACVKLLRAAEIEHRNIRLHERVTESLVHQRYKFGRLLGQGSSAAVYEARHKRTGGEVAIKVIRKDGGALGHAARECSRRPSLFSSCACSPRRAVRVIARVPRLVWQT